MIPKVSIIVVTHNQAEKSCACFKAIHKHCRVPYEIIWVDNGSDRNHFLNTKRVAVAKNKQVKSIQLKKNFGFIKGVNAAIPYIEPSSEYVVLLDNDTEIGHHAIDNMLKPLQYKEIGVVGCLTQSKMSWQEPTNLNKIFPKLKTIPYSGSGYSETINKKFGGKYLDVGINSVALFAVAFRKDVFVDVLKGLDEDFKTGLCLDEYICHKLRFLGYKNLVALDAFVYHHHRTTFKSLKFNLDALRRESVKILKLKLDELK